MTPSDLFPPGNLNDDYDSPWKEALKRYLPDFLAWPARGTGAQALVRNSDL